MHILGDCELNGSLTRLFSLPSLAEIELRISSRSKLLSKSIKEKITKLKALPLCSFMAPGETETAEVPRDGPRGAVTVEVPRGAVPSGKVAYIYGKVKIYKTPFGSKRPSKDKGTDYGYTAEVPVLVKSC